MHNLKVIVDREKWLHGEGGMTSMLYRPKDGKMCCLGFACVAAGLTKSQISGIRTPVQLVADTTTKLPPQLSSLIETGRIHSQPCHSLMLHNDSDTCSEEEREEKVIHHGKLAGIDFEFVN